MNDIEDKRGSNNLEHQMDNGSLQVRAQPEILGCKINQSGGVISVN